MLQNARVAAFTTSDLLRENQHVTIDKHVTIAKKSIQITIQGSSQMIYPIKSNTSQQLIGHQQ